MTERERLIELLRRSEILCDDCGPYGNTYCTEAIADHLLANGVILPPCKVGDTVYSIEKGIDHQIFIGEVYETTKRREGFWFRYTRRGYFTGASSFDDIGKTVFLTKEDAEKALKERSEGK